MSSTATIRRVGESHRVELTDAAPIGSDLLIEFRDLDRPHRAYRESYARSEVAEMCLGDRGTLTLRSSRVQRDGRWSFAAD